MKQPFQKAKILLKQLWQQLVVITFLTPVLMLAVIYARLIWEWMKFVFGI